MPDLLTSLHGAGVPIVEVGFPFSDPIADGPVIAAAMHQALSLGVTPNSLFDEIRAARERTEIGMVGMVTVSLIWRAGPAEFARRAAESGLDGIIVPDLPVEESAEVLEPFRERGLSTILLVSPATSPERLKRIVQACSGFVYLLARAGVTGETSEVPEVAESVARIRALTDLPIACGFGISTPAQVKAVVKHADAAIVGSALVRRMESTDPVAEAVSLVRDLCAAIT